MKMVTKTREQLKAEGIIVSSVAPVRTWKVSPKGCLSVYGLGRFPVSLYGSQWSALLDDLTPEQIAKIRAFAQANPKGDVPTVVAAPVVSASKPF